MRDKNSQTMFQYLQAPKELNPASKAGELDEATLLSRLPKEVHGPAKEIKDTIRTLGKEYGQLLQESKAVESSDSNHDQRRRIFKTSIFCYEK